MIAQLVKPDGAPPAGQKQPDPVSILGRLEAVMSAGVQIGRISRACGLGENIITELLESDERGKLGQLEEPGCHHPQMLKRKRSDESEQLARIDSWLAAYGEERRAELRRCVETPTRAMLEGIIANARREKMLSLVVGSYGIGKSFTFSEFAQRVPRTKTATGAVYVAFCQDDKSTASVYQRIAEGMRITGWVISHKKTVSRAVVDNLRQGDVILCDEANYLFDNGNINVLRDIFDASPASLVLAANPLYLEFLKTSRKGIAAFLSRAETIHIESNVEADIEAVLAAEHLPDTIRATAIAIGTRSGETGGLRVLYRVIRRAEKRAAQVGRSVDAKVFQQSARDLGLM